MPDVHVRHNGQSHTFSFGDIFTPERLEGLGLSVEAGSEFSVQELNPQQVKTAVAQHMDTAVTEFDDYEVEYAKSGNVTVRPSAVFG